MSHPLVSIGLPVYNEGRHVAHTLDSLLAQDYPDLEIVISDNSSTDDTGEICQRYATRDSRVRYFRQPVNVGASRNFNLTLEMAQGEFFHWAGGHDPHPSNLISACVKVLRSKPDLALCYTPVMWQDGEDASGSVDTRDERDPLKRLKAVLWGTSGGAIYGVFRTSLLRRTLIVERAVASDVLLLAEVSVFGGFAFLPEPTLVMTKDGSFGDWSVYVRKIFGETTQRPRMLYGHALRRLCLRTGRHFRLIERLPVYSICATAFWTRFGWIREGLREIA